MSVLKALIGALVGGIAAYFIKDNVSFTGSVLLVGLLAGLGARLLAGANRSFLTGLIAAIVAMAVVLGSSYAQSQAMINSIGDVSVPAITAEEAAARIAEEEAAGETEEADEENTESPTEDDEPEVASTVVTPTLNIPVAKHDSSQTGKVTTLDLFLNCLSPLLAFILGAGAGKRAIDDHHLAVEPGNDETTGKP